MKKRRFPFLRAVMPRVPKRVLGGWLKTCRNQKFQMGMTGAPFGPTELLVPPPESPGRALARGEGPRVPGGWGVGKKLKNVSLLGHLVLSFFKSFEKNEKMMKSVKFARIGLLLIQNESPHRVLDSCFLFCQFF